MIVDLDNYRRLGKAVRGNDIGLRIDRYLAKGYRFRSRHQWQLQLRLGCVLVNGTVVRKASYLLRAGDEVRYYFPSTREPRVDASIKILWEESGIVAMFKPSGLPMHEAGVYHRNTFAELIGKELGPRWAPVHRLDRETSGIVLCAEDKVTRNAVASLFRRCEVQKSYLAITFGRSLKRSFSVAEPIGNASQTRFRFKKWVTSEGLPSRTDFDVICSSSKATLFRVRPRTGRTHQIRVHAAWSGFHLIGDKKYHPDESVYLEYVEKGFTPMVAQAVAYERLCLHAAAMEFVHPLTRKKCAIASEVPQDMQSIWESYSKNTSEI